VIERVRLTETPRASAAATAGVTIHITIHLLPETTSHPLITHLHHPDPDHPIKDITPQAVTTEESRPDPVGDSKTELVPV